YFNRRDRREGTVHVGFSGIETSRQGKGLGTRLRSYGIKHFRSNGLAGISSRISFSNTASLRSNEKLGFKVVEQYYDSTTNEQRYYLVCRLAPLQETSRQ